MKIVQAAGELYPFMKTGGLADVVSALAAALADKGNEVSAFLPGYRAALEHPHAARAQTCLQLKIEMGDRTLSGEIRSFAPRRNLAIYFVCREEFFDRRNAYGNGDGDYQDNAERFIFFNKAVVDAVRRLDLRPDIVHGHDWHAALLPILFRDAQRKRGLDGTFKTILTIHNIAFQGLFPAATFAQTNLPDELNAIEGLEYCGQVNLLKGGILFADRVTTVSPNYAREIQTPEFGFGLDGVIQSRADHIVGLLNGVDTAVWNPSSDPSLPARYSAKDLSGKRTCRAALLQSFGFAPDFSGPIFGIVCRFSAQKGIDLLLSNRSFFFEENCRLVILGKGDKRYEDELRSLAAQIPEKVGLRPQFDEARSHLIEAGSDFFLMPSLFEPCGLNQMYSQIYGTVPIASRVGGLADTVTDADDNPAMGTGLMCPPTSADLRRALGRALRLFADQSRYAGVQQRGMAREFGWERAAVAYEQLYRESL
ncbi:MAG: glycogen synthase GlgA [Opitutaceae bacterium]|jgi:starch synthase